ncbi:hypothetical protein [Mangrovibacterium sp.]|uniref:hypothetical protein n=1 Tax=Mangrovibacterium sp. TaxID=1961364 RepID=UPI0035675CCF
MTRLKICLLFLICVFYVKAFGQDHSLKDVSPLNRFHHEEYGSFREYIARNVYFPPEAFENTGVLLAGMVLDTDGGVKQVFSFNSLAPSIDNNVLSLFESTKGYWKALDDSMATKKSEIVIVPVVFCMKGGEYNIDSSNFKLQIQDEVVVTVFIESQLATATNYQKSEVVLNKYDKLMSKERYPEAYEIMVELLRREPLNTDYYSRLIMLSSVLGDNESACQNLKFVKTYFVNQPDPDIISIVDCE